MARRIKPSSLPKNGSGITPQRPQLDDGIVRFSFKHLDVGHEKFCCTEKGAAYFLKVLERLRALSTMKAQEILANRSSALRAHPIDWADTSEPEGFRHLNSQLRDVTAYQFEISANEHGRVHGFFIDHVFFVVWLDPDHKLYP